MTLRISIGDSGRKPKEMEIYKFSKLLSDLRQIESKRLDKTGGVAVTILKILWLSFNTIWREYKMTIPMNYFFPVSKLGVILFQQKLQWKYTELRHELRPKFPLDIFHSGRLKSTSCKRGFFHIYLPKPSTDFWKCASSCCRNSQKEPLNLPYLFFPAKGELMPY